ncbi:carboxylating nicotinate-nucleotide diphosphorylase [Parvularcula sp. IMCC14364]|uniref:carboxylating nicotinate-nucleotide diphosphorylase n=1 Tax=Parvularcula sp. IMCC14364 TaxID=3067902 RepID=UPI002741C803|nr:carboxylating nicotinate-nucleotide diphosphorylase [Parvularcula sp. IMCC14364]
MAPHLPLPRRLIETSVQSALVEDLGDAGDVTTLATIPTDAQGKAVIRARKTGRLAGMELAEAAFTLVSPGVTLTRHCADGAMLNTGDDILEITGSVHAILSAERVALNFLGHLSGIATATHELVEAVAGTNAKIVCTRKTLPTLRAFQKYAVTCGGGFNHRFGLYDAVMIKDNHIAACGGITNALKAAKSRIGHMVKVEIEVDTLAQLEEVLREGADVILLDNMSTDQLAQAVKLTKGRATLEASGNITVSTVRAIAETGVNVISSGWITHSAPNLDLGLDYIA